MKRLFESSDAKYYQIDEDTIYFADGHYMVKMPIELYDQELAARSDRLKDSATIAECWHNTDLKEMIDKYMPDETVLSERMPGTFTIRDGHKVAALKSTAYNSLTKEPIAETVLLNPRFYDAAEQMTRGGMIRQGMTQHDPVFFFDGYKCDHMGNVIHADVMVMVLPIRYREVPVNEDAKVA